MTEYAPDEVLRRWLLADSLNFSRYFFKHLNNGKRFVIGKHHRLICDKLNQVLQGKIKRLIINIAPRYGKTEIAVKNFIAMGLALNPAAKFIHLSYSGNLALDNSVAVKNIVNSEEYQRLFNVRVGRSTDTKSRWDTYHGGGVYATSSLGQVTGFGAGAVESEDEENPSLEEQSLSTTQSSRTMLLTTMLESKSITTLKRLSVTASTPETLR